MFNNDEYESLPKGYIVGEEDKLKYVLLCLVTDFVWTDFDETYQFGAVIRTVLHNP